jgi:hypothetical protein
MRLSYNNEFAGLQGPANSFHGYMCDMVWYGIGYPSLRFLSAALISAIFPSVRL